MRSGISVMRSIGSEIGVAESAGKLAKLARRLKATSRFTRLPLPCLWFLTDEERTPDPVEAAKRLPPGCGVVLRHYRAPNRRELARELAVITRERNLLLLIGADCALAREVRAHGVHVPGWVRKCRRKLAWRGIITASAHSIAELRAAQAAGATAVFAGTVFATESHKGAHALGPVRFSQLVRSSALPVIALGGIDAGNARQLLGSGAVGLGAIGALLPANDNRGE